ncbi:MAG TPA: TIGR03619 family F420-dependent LLM class oxidoreductase [Mycobacteriales bacterium]|jgi:probable F420-dependent oxidoreductase|nr:TIGR03619 family F420-dependent LLM class oxidoreductase [Mycobacteriales bacterium]
MHLQVVLPDESPDVAPDRILGLAREAEGLGYQTAWLPDHLLPPGEYGEVFGGVYEPLVTLGAIAAVTDRMRLGTSVLVLPMRSPFVVAKQVATLERLAPGRVVLGIGAGWQEQEFESVGSRFAGRGARTDDAIRLLRHLFEVGHGPFENDQYGFQTGVFQPVPTGPIPIMVGGMSDVALRRVARLGDAWQAVGVTPAEFRARVGTLRGQAERPVVFGARIGWPELPADPAAELAEWRDAGADELAIWFGKADGFGDRMAAVMRSHS